MTRDPAAMAAALAAMPPEVRGKASALLEELTRRKRVAACKTDFLEFVQAMWPGFIMGKHHAIMADAFEKVANKDIKRVIINMPPRHTKSEFASYLLPAWFLGQFPDKKVIQTSHTSELATGFGRKVRNLVDSQTYKGIFPGVALQADSKAAGRWSTNKGGEYFAIGVGGAVTGKGADLLIIDDPHSEQEAALGEVNKEVYDRVYEWYTSGPRQRLQPGGAIIIVMTRWSKRDLTAQVLKSSLSRGSDEWELIELPAIMPSGKPLWPQFWALPELQAIKDELPVHKWDAQYMQQPSGAGGSIIRKEWWKEWEDDEPPEVDYIIQSWDCAYSAKERADYSACTTWGVFYKDNDEGRKRPNLILLDAYKARMDFPDLKKKALELYREYKPDTCIIEAKAAGTPLVQELRASGVMLSDYSPSRGSDKITRVNSIADIFASGVVWAPHTRWASEVIEEFASFPAGENDDLVDSSTQALMRFRQGGLIPLPSDEEDDETPTRRRRAAYY
jgi:predicted phage terminase large subunit-like protein